jgi:7,8-dihydropterin-6-yl-methyl-4-(beta-D-ribofuranosyl)aminobenzene 5'-phosphate synthase
MVGNNLLGEPGLSFYIEDDQQKILFDLGLNDTFLKNAKQLNIGLNDLDYVVVSHGHDDHIGGLFHLINYYKDIPPP